MRLPEPGEIFEGYRIAELIGSGGFARVYAATTSDLGREVAVKILAPGPDGYDPLLVRRFLAEARAVASLEDPHTLSLFSHGRAENGLLYLTFERLGGEDLNTLLTRAQRLSEAQALHIIRQVLHSLREAHERGLLHRDIKPENIRVYPHLDDPHFVKVMDFGIAKSVIEVDTPLTRTGQIVGTPRYMAPEQLMEVQLTPAADVYSTGLVLYDMIFGLDARGKPAISGLHVAASTGLSPHTLHILNNALAGPPEARFRDAAAMLRAVDEPPPATAYDVGPAPDSSSWSSMSASSPPPRPPTVAEDDSAWPQRSLVAAVGIVIAVVAVAALASGLRESTPEVSPQPTRRANPLSSTPSRVTAITAEQPPEEHDDEPPATACDRPVSPGHSAVSETIGLDSTRWAVYVPQTYEVGRQHPVIILIHDQMVSADAFIRHPPLLNLADKHGVLLYAPDDEFVEPWMDRGDLDHVKRGLELVRRDFCVDEERVFAVGHGRGAKIAERLACQGGVAGIATTNHTSGNNPSNPCSTPTPQIYLHGMDDPFHPGSGGESCTGKSRESVDVRDARLGAVRGCSSTVKTAFKTKNGRCVTWDCDVPYVSCRVDGGHNWPGMTDRVIDTAGCESAPPRFPFAQTIWSFFENGVVGDER